MAEQLPDCRLSISVHTDEYHTDLHMKKKPTADCESLSINTLSLSTTSTFIHSCGAYADRCQTLQQSIFARYIKLHAGLQLTAERATAPQVNTIVLFREQNLPVC